MKGSKAARAGSSVSSTPMTRSRLWVMQRRRYSAAKRAAASKSRWAYRADVFGLELAPARRSFFRLARESPRLVALQHPLDRGAQRAMPGLRPFLHMDVGE